MKKTKILLFVTVSLFWSALTQALPIRNADAFVKGDGKAIKELKTGLIWLDAGINYDKSFDAIKSNLEAPHSEWRLPTEGEVIGLWSNLFGALDEWESPKDGYGKILITERHLDYVDNIFDIFMQYEHYPDYLEGRFMTSNGISSAYITKEYAGLLKGTMIFSDNITRYEASTLLVKKTHSLVSEPSTLPLIIITLFILVKIRRLGED